MKDRPEIVYELKESLPDNAGISPTISRYPGPYLLGGFKEEGAAAMSLEAIIVGVDKSYIREVMPEALELKPDAEAFELHIDPASGSIMLAMSTTKASLEERGLIAHQWRPSC